MGVTESLVVGAVLLVAVVAALSVTGHRKLDAALKSLATAFKFD